MTKNADQLERADLKGERVPAPPAAARLSPAELSAAASMQLRQDITVTALKMELTARRPYDAAGLMDFYQPGRWDATSNLVYMMPDAGDDVTYGYAQFKASAAGNHLVVLNFNGYEVTLRAFGPWGTVSAYSPTASGNVALTALWTATAGATLYFNFSCTGVGLAYLSSVQVHSL
jgi:hypothetical protein